MSPRVAAALVWTCLLPSSTLIAQSARADSAAVAATVQAYHGALAKGDSAAVLRLLAPDAVILEGGDFETRAEYHAHHLAADIAYAKALPSVRGMMVVRVSGDMAWASSTSTTQGTYRDRPVNSVGAELMVLSRAGTGWVIRAIHWSSRSKRTGS